MNRKHFLHAMTALAAAASLATATQAGAQTGPIKIGEVNSYKVLDFFKARQILEICDRLKEPLKRDLAARIEDFVRR